MQTLVFDFYYCQFAPDQFRVLYLKFLPNIIPDHVLVNYPAEAN